MSRVIKKIEIEGKKVNALFDTGSFNTYIERRLLKRAPKLLVPYPYTVKIGGKTIEVKEISLFLGKIEGLGFHGEAIPIEKSFEIDGKKVSAIIGALIMEKWAIIVNPKNGTLNLEGLKKREFIDF